MTSEHNDDEIDSPRGLDVGLDRRALLGAAAGGFALAAGGLLLPAWLADEAEADGHPVQRIQNRKQRHREKRGNRLERRRNQHRRQDGNQSGNDDKPQQGPYKDIEFRFGVSGGRPVFVKLFQLFGCCWEYNGGQGTYAPGRSETYVADSRIAALQIDNNLWIKAINPLFPPWASPEVWLGHGGTFGEHDDLENGTTVSISGLAVGGRSAVLERDGYSIQAIRLEDNARKVFNVKIVSPTA